MSIWDELCIVEDIHVCTCNVATNIHKYLEEKRLIQLLMGLYDTYKSLREHMLMMKHLPSVSTVYSMIIK